MNKKIEELIKESNLEECIDDAYLMRDDWQHFIEKFAGLIVRECADLVDDYVNENVNERAGQRITKYFNIE